MVSLAQLVSEVGDALRATAPLPTPSPVVTGVHVSELIDPTPYLDGGELVLTTGVPFAVRGEQPAAYVARLAARGVSGLALGLGEGFDEVPAALGEACRAHRVPLFAVPSEAPFQRLTRAYWALVAGGDRAAMVQSLSAQARIVRAIGSGDGSGQDATAQIVRTLAQSLGGWAAYLPYDDARLPIAWPATHTGLLPEVRRETRRLFSGTALAAATFEVNRHDVVAYPVSSADAHPGALALGAGRPLTAADRLLAVTAQAALATLHARPVPAPAAPLDELVTELLAAGHVEAARLVARRAMARRPAPADDEVAAWVSSLAATPLLPTVREHLRGGCRWERTARALGVHRNTVRQRIAAAESLLGRSIDDADVSSRLWLALRDAG
ncbi:PucR family transcriptional regulator [Microbacterium sp. NPDC096154]|uniref:PucR family transcriptional regulator n=1 Tax=Microbacterium sp. NPDC096154 TaxID=3155549 RepID=UPI003328A170